MQQTAAHLPYANVTPLADLVAPSIRPWRLGTTMFGAFAGLALVLAAVGLYGVLSYTVAQRTQEIGIRVAMGAQRGDVLRLTVGQGVRIAALGAGIGAVVALVGGRVLSSLLYGVSPRSLPFPRANRLLDIKTVPERYRSGARWGGTSELTWYQTWRTAPGVFEDLAAYIGDQPVLIGPWEAVRVETWSVTANFFPLLGARPLLGRAFLPEEDRPGPARHAVLSHRLWAARYGS